VGDSIGEASTGCVFLRVVILRCLCSGEGRCSMRRSFGSMPRDSEDVEALEGCATNSSSIDEVVLTGFLRLENVLVRVILLIRGTKLGRASSPMSLALSKGRRITLCDTGAWSSSSSMPGSDREDVEDKGSSVSSIFGTDGAVVDVRLYTTVGCRSTSSSVTVSAAGPPESLYCFGCREFTTRSLTLSCSPELEEVNGASS
jgi:hypothetical protein